MNLIKKTFKVNGIKQTVEFPENEKLLWVLREKLKLTGTKYSCGEGICGACSVLINGNLARACIIPASTLGDGTKITTIEGLSFKGKLSPLQQAFIDHDAFCCGYCTPGMIMTATALLNRNPKPSRDEIVAAMDSNLCRCASYPNIIKAIQAVAGTED